MMAIAPRMWRIDRVRYERLVERGVFEPGDHVELLDGLLVAREPQGSRHAAVVDLIRAALERAFGKGYYVRDNKPLALDGTSEPEPDVVVVRGRPQDYLDSHPSSPLLLVEVADTSLALDRLRKAGLYARAGIADYWIVNLADTVLEVYRQPVRDSSRLYGWKYGCVRLLKRRSMASPLAMPKARIRVSSLLPL